MKLLMQLLGRGEGDHRWPRAVDSCSCQDEKVKTRKLDMRTCADGEGVAAVQVRVVYLCLVFALP